MIRALFSLNCKIVYEITLFVNDFQNGEMNPSQRLLQMQDLLEKTKAILAGQQPAVPLGPHSIDEVEKRFVEFLVVSPRCICFTFLLLRFQSGSIFLQTPCKLNSNHTGSL